MHAQLLANARRRYAALYFLSDQGTKPGERRELRNLQVTSRRPWARVAATPAERRANSTATLGDASSGDAALDGGASCSEPAWAARDDPRALNRTFRRLGYLQIPDLGLTVDDLDEVRRLLDGLFERFHELPANIAHERALSNDPTNVVVPEIIQCTRLEPKLLRTPVYQAVTSLAAELLGSGSRMIFDHAIYKPPGPSAPTPWHQDSAYGRDTGLTIWLPFQPTGVADGCMRYVPGSHRGGTLAHQRGATPANSGILHLDDELVESLGPVSAPIPLGGVTVHARKTIHGAWPNAGDELRRAWISVFSKPTRRSRIRRLLRPRPPSSAG